MYISLCVRLDVHIEGENQRHNCKMIEGGRKNNNNNNVY